MNLAVRGALAGGLGAATLVASDALSRARLGQPAVFAPSRIAHRLARKRLGRWLTARQARRVGAAMRAVYGPLLGATLVPLASRLRSLPLSAFAIAQAVGLFEAVVLPATGATPRLSRWRPAERRLWGLHVAWFGLTTAALSRAIARYRGSPAGSVA